MLKLTKNDVYIELHYLLKKFISFKGNLKMYPSKKDTWIRFLDFAYNLPLDVLLAMNLVSLPVSFLNMLMNLNFKYKYSIS